MCTEELILAQRVLNVLNELAHPPALVHLVDRVVALRVRLVAPRPHCLAQVVECGDGRLLVEASLVRELHVGREDLLQGCERKHHGVLLLSQPVIDLVLVAHLALVEALHLVDEDLVALQLEVLVLLHVPRDLSGEAHALGGLLADLLLEVLQRAADVLLSTLLRGL